MRIVKVALVFMLFSVVIACTGVPNRSPVASNALHAKVKMNYDQANVEEAMQVKGISFVSKPPRKDWVLSGVEPLLYAVGSARERTAPEEEASIYIFDSARHRQEGVDDFRRQAEKYNMIVPRMYEKRNVLILYWAGGDRNKPAKLDEKFTNAIRSLYAMTEFSGVTTGVREVPYSIFIGGKRYGGLAFEKGAAIHSIDTHMNGRVHTVQIRGWRLPSDITVEHRGDNVLIDYSESSSSSKEHVVVRFREDDVEPADIRVSLNGRKQRLAGIEFGIE
ncbi:hypothetical protein FE782_03280 [Paenibacillus antri]|uniref:Uncharacterized protein n=1 Tax=Paenibacillus antri TaxID=2582848 RepID=A0A5R9GC44_9BACL|nr:hypothetical protein [Paenibacillus antri]TLS53311.1 hypothetical protein FE782_03280 [Paenibacillus antri]